MLRLTPDRQSSTSARNSRNLQREKRSKENSLWREPHLLVGEVSMAVYGLQSVVVGGFIS